MTERLACLTGSQSWEGLGPGRGRIWLRKGEGLQQQHLPNPDPLPRCDLPASSSRCGGRRPSLTHWTSRDLPTQGAAVAPLALHHGDKVSTGLFVRPGVCRGVRMAKSGSFLWHPPCQDKWHGITSMTWLALRNTHPTRLPSGTAENSWLPPPPAPAEPRKPRPHRLPLGPAFPPLHTGRHPRLSHAGPPPPRLP